MGRSQRGQGEGLAARELTPGPAVPGGIRHRRSLRRVLSCPLRRAVWQLAPGQHLDPRGHRRAGRRPGDPAHHHQQTGTNQRPNRATGCEHPGPDARLPRCQPAAQAEIYRRVGLKIAYKQVAAARTAQVADAPARALRRHRIASPSTPAQRRPIAAVETMYSAQQPPASSARPNPRASTFVGPAPNRRCPARRGPPTPNRAGGGCPRPRAPTGPRTRAGHSPSGTRRRLRRPPRSRAVRRGAGRRGRAVLTPVGERRLQRGRNQPGRPSRRRMPMDRRMPR